MNIYKEILAQNLNKLLSIYDRDRFSSTYGYGDREFWGWKTKDFTNATLQGGVHTLAIALKLNLFEKEQESYIIEMIESAISAIDRIARSNGSVEEAYPQENSFCVTAIVAFDTLSALNHLKESIDISRHLESIKPLIEFITKNGEEHAIISNHLATGVAAITLWNHLSGENNHRDRELLQIIYENQSKEGWYREYEGADPGYQTLCTYYLFCAYDITKDKELLLSLKKSAKFLAHFIHPDGTIGGLYGSRNTEVYYPAGVLGLSLEIDEFAHIAKYLKPQGQHLLPQQIDIGNYIPLLNSYAIAALEYEKSYEKIESNSIEPFYSCDERDRELSFDDAGLYLYSNQSYFTIINYKKGGTIKIYDKSTNSVDLEDGGLFGILYDGDKFSTQQFDNGISFRDQKIKCDLYKINQSHPNPLNFIILRVLSMTIFHSVYLGNLFKNFIVNMLMTSKDKLDGSVLREFEFLSDKIMVKEHIIAPRGTKEIDHRGKTKSIHMASSGYFIPQDFDNQRSKLVEFVNV